MAFDGTEVKVQKETLKERAARWKAATKGTQWPLQLAAEVISVVDNWSQYKQEAGGITASAFCTEVFGSQGHGVAYFRKRLTAIKRLGSKDVCNRLNHEVAVWVAYTLPAEHHIAVRDLLFKAYRQNKGVPLNMNQARLLIAQVLGLKSTRGVKACSRCMRLEQLLTANNIPIPK